MDAPNILRPGISHLLSRPKCVSWLLDPSTCCSIRAKKFMWETQIWCRGKKRQGCHKNTKFWASFLRVFMELFCSAGLGRNFERKAWKVGTNEQRSLMGRTTKEQGRSPAGSNTETSVSHRTKRTQTFGAHMVFEISSQFQTIWWIELTLPLSSLTGCEQRP